MARKKDRFIFLLFSFLIAIMLLGCSNSEDNKSSKEIEFDLTDFPRGRSVEKAAEEPPQEHIVTITPKEEDRNKPSEDIMESIDDNEVFVEVYKEERILKLWEGEQLSGEYPVGLGFNPIGHKKKEGDGKTPEGSYYVCVKNPNSRFYLSLGLSYPNADDAQDALSSDLITKDEHDSINEAINNQRTPLWYTALGGEIMIHGHGSSYDWTEGCVAVEDEIMDILWEKCQVGTKVFIFP